MSQNDGIPKRAKLTGIKRFFKETRKDEQTSVSDEHNLQPISVPNLSRILEEPVVYPTLESSSTALIGSSHNGEIGATIHSLAETDKNFQLDFGSSDYCGQQSMSTSRGSSTSECVDDIPLLLDNNEPDSLNFPTSGSRKLPCSSSSITVSSMSNASNVTSLDKPNQPEISVIPVQRLSSRAIHFQKDWFQKYQWLHYSSDLKKVICFY